MTAYDYRTIIIGAGAGGLVVAIGAARAGQNVLLIENGNYGGDCTNFGCIPSKALIASAHAAHILRHPDKFGLRTNASDFDGSGALKRGREIVQHFRSHESPEALAAQGIDTLTGVASFLDPHTLHVDLENGDTQRVTGNQIVIATGSSAFLPPISGLEDTPFHTNETIFSMDSLPKHLCVIGGGAIGCELSSAFHRLGCQVSLIEAAPCLLIREEPETQEVIEETLRKEGISVQLEATVENVQYLDEQFTVSIHTTEQAARQQIHCDALMIAVGRTPNISSLNLHQVGIEATSRGIWVDAYGRTSVKNVWAIGDVTGIAQFTHVAEAHGRAVLANLLLPGLLMRKRDLAQAIPTVTYTDPEVARVGATEREARQKYGSKHIKCYLLPISQIDRAITEGAQAGFIKLVTKKWSGRLIGATICSPRAGEMLPELSLAIREKIPLRRISTLIHPYPTYNHGIRRAADKWLTETILPALKRLFGRG